MLRRLNTIAVVAAEFSTRWRRWSRTDRAGTMRWTQATICRILVRGSSMEVMGRKDFLA